MFPLNVETGVRRFAARKLFISERRSGEGGEEGRGEGGVDVCPEEGNNPTGVFRLGKGVNTSLAVIRFAKKGERKKEARRGRGKKGSGKRKRRVSRCKLGNCKSRIQRDAIT